VHLRFTHYVPFMVRGHFPVDRKLYVSFSKSSIYMLWSFIKGGKLFIFNFYALYPHYFQSLGLLAISNLKEKEGKKMNLTFRSSLRSPVRLIVARKGSSVFTETNRREIRKVDNFLEKKKIYGGNHPFAAAQHLSSGNRVSLLTSHNLSSAVSQKQ
jgi:hypothetical protein